MGARPKYNATLKRITFYADPGFKGKSKEEQVVLKPTPSDIRLPCGFGCLGDRGTLGVDTISSVRVPAGVVVRLYDNYLYGKSVLLTADSSDLTALNFDNKTKAYRACAVGSVSYRRDLCGGDAPKSLAVGGG